MRQKADVLYSEESIARRVAELGSEITRAFEGRELRVLGLLADQAAIAVRNAELYQQVSEERRALSAIIDNSAEGVMILDAAGQIQVFNRALAHMTGWDAQEALGRPPAEVRVVRDEEPD